MQTRLRNSILILSSLLTSVAGAADTATNTPPRWKSNIALGLTLTKGNIDTTLFTAKAATERKGPSDEWFFDADGSYGKSEGVVNNETLHGFGQYNHLFSDRFYAYGKLDGLHDGVADLKYRFTASPGAGYYLLKEKTTTLAGEVGPAFIQEKLADQSRGYMTARAAERFEHKFSDLARMWESLEYLPQVDDFNHYLVNGEIGAAAKLVGNLELQIYLQDFFNSRPAPGRKDNDVRLVSAIGYTF